MKGKVLIIAGSDSGGGAGIQGDIKTVTALGGYAATAVTALTAQNTRGVFGIMEVPDEFIAQQIDLVLEDIGADVIKTGMLHRPGVIKVIIDCLEKNNYMNPLVVDPVMVAKGGAPLLQEEALNYLKILISKAFLVTPNIPEAEVLTGMKISNPEDMAVAARKLLQMGCESVLVKGGHLETDEVYNVLALRGSEKIFTSKRYDSKHTHGTGCTFASAISTFIAQGLSISEAIEQSLAYISAAIKEAPLIGKGNGPLNHMPTQWPL